LAFGACELGFIAANPTDPDNLYLGIYGYGVYRSEDGAATWLPANTGLGNRYVYSLLVEENGGYLWAGTNDGAQSLWRSPTGTPGRLDWAPAPDAPPSFQAITGIEINPENPDEITVAAFPAGVFATPDEGMHSVPDHRAHSTLTLLPGTIRAWQLDDGARLPGLLKQRQSSEDRRRTPSWNVKSGGRQMDRSGLTDWQPVLYLHCFLINQV